MSVKDQLTDTWGLVTAASLGGLGGAVTAALAPAPVLAIPVGLGIAGAVYGVKVALDLLAQRSGAPPRRAAPADSRLPAPPRGSPSDHWLRRAQAAVSTLRRQTESPLDGDRTGTDGAARTLHEQIGDVDDQAAGALADLRRFAGQVTVIEQTMAGVNVRGLRQERGRIERTLAGLPAGPLRDERERSLRAVGDQLDVAARLASAREMLLARMQSAVLGLEGLVARLAELLALHATTAGGSLTVSRLAELTGDLEGMRAGLAEAEELSRSTLAGDAGGAPRPESGA